MQNNARPRLAVFTRIVCSARQRTGRARLELVNERINAAIRYKSDEEQWGVPDLWSAPLSTFATGFGDCEDYVIAKYVALHESGVPAGDLRMVLGYDQQRMTGHAVLAVHDGDDWLILDQPAHRLVAAVEIYGYVPLFSFGTRGVSLLVMPYVGHAMAAVETVGAAPEKTLDLSKRAGRISPTYGFACDLTFGEPPALQKRQTQMEAVMERTQLPQLGPNGPTP